MPSTSQVHQEQAPFASPLVSVVIPCLDEERTIGRVIDTAWRALHATGFSAEVIVADNGSSDRSREEATAHGARVVSEQVRGYGAALRRGCEAARGRFIVMGDADESYDFEQMGPFLQELEAGADLVMGTRTRGCRTSIAGCERSPRTRTKRWISTPPAWSSHPRW